MTTLLPWSEIFDEVRYFRRPATRDERGSFRRAYSVEEYERLGIGDTFVEDNISTSQNNVLRGLHFDMRLAKFVQVLLGDVFDVVVDVRRGSATFGRWAAFSISAEGCEQLYVPRGFAHGFYVRSEIAIVSYKQTDVYDPGHEGQVRYDDPAIGIAWPFVGTPILSQKDAAAPLLDRAV
jgi:dTDP-4-dehydrorhamnose 3,5-epimerase